jgi:RimJ/RimL family protein N-acetyltransferase
MTNLQVREMEERDVNLIASYWVDSDPDHMVSMGVDLDKIPKRSQIQNMLMEQLSQDYSEKGTYALIWVVDGVPVGHCNVNKIEFGKKAYMHLHFWQSKYRAKGMGSNLLKMSLPYFFERLNLQELLCEPYALNPAPNKILEKIGFKFIKSHICVPGYLNFEQEVNTWGLTREDFESMT